MKRLIVTIFLFAAFVLCPHSAHAQETKAENIADGCVISSSDGDTAILHDGLLDNTFVLESGKIDIVLPESGAQGVYIKWDHTSFAWDLSYVLKDGTTAQMSCGKRGLLQEYCPLPKDTASFSISSSSVIALLEMEIYSSGILPECVHLWGETPTMAELMVISTHQDDEVLFFGGVIPYYSGELKLDTVVVYATYDNGLRQHEALEGLWACGLKQHPVFLNYQDRLYYTIESALELWGEEAMTASLVECIEKYRPQVIVTHDFEGEYGHGQHKAIAYCTVKAVESSAQAEGGWDVPKCYIHLYAQNEIVFEWSTMKLESFSGMTALEVAAAGYDKHKSQHKFGYAVLESGYGDCRRFGLYRTTVGSDTKADLFENIKLRFDHRDIPANRMSNELISYGRSNVYKRQYGDNVQYLRYGAFAGDEGWYMCDSTGIVLEPQVKAAVLHDETPEEYYWEYKTGGNSRVPIYIYTNSGGETIVSRYGTIHGEQGWFACERTGELLQPPVQVESPPYNGLLHFFRSQSESTWMWTGLAVSLAVVVFVMIVKSCRRKKKIYTR